MSKTSETPTSGIQLIVGLGNPGVHYADHRHNVGFWFIEKLSIDAKAVLAVEPKFKARTNQIQFHHLPVRLLQPTTYMNLSGESVLAICQFYKIKPEQILVVHDELDLPVGCARFKFDGGHGGHNGLRDIIAKLGTKQFYRLRLGIGHPGNKEDVHDYVLHRPSISDKEKLLTAIDEALLALPDLLMGQFEKAMTKLHTTTK